MHNESQHHIDEARHDHDHSRDIQIKLNHKPVTVTHKEMTGLQIKDVAIAQGVNIKRDFILFEVKPNGKRHPIDDNELVKLHNGLEFEAIADDDNS